MINYEKFTLSNGLRVLVYKVETTAAVAVNIIYNVGSKDEDPEKTGFAHLFEHLMFGGSENIPDFDAALQDAGGSNNAFTNNDFTNYYINLPKENIETAFWLESDRMLSLLFSEKSLETQKKVVIEEYNEQVLNSPYGDMLSILRPFVYKKHSYSWPTIGKDISHIANANLENVKEFFLNHYAPNNAILSVAGNVEPEKVFELAQKWFGEIEPRKIKQRNLVEEPEQMGLQKMIVERDVPANSIYKAYKIPGRLHPDFYAIGLLIDILSGSDSSRLYLRLVKNENIFFDVDTYLGGTIETDLFIFSGKLHKRISFEKAEKFLKKEIDFIKTEYVLERELQKVKNKLETLLLLDEIDLQSSSMNLGYYELLGDASLINTQIENYNKVSVEDIKRVAEKYLTDSDCSTLYYKSKKNRWRLNFLINNNNKVVFY